MDSIIFPKLFHQSKIFIQVILFILLYFSSSFCISNDQNITPSDSLVTTSADSQKEEKLQVKVNKFIPLQIQQDSISDFSYQISRYEMSSTLTHHIGNRIERLPGIILIDPSSTGLPVNARIRGSSIQQTQVSIDGFPINHEQFGPFDFSLLPTEAFERIETTGPNFSTVTPARLNSINLVTEEINLKNPRTKIVWNKGSYGDSEVDVEFGQQISDRTHAVGAVAYESSDGRYTNSEYNAQKIRFQLIARPKSKWYLRYHLFYNRSDIDLPQIQNTEVETGIPNTHRKSNHYIHLLDMRTSVKSDSIENIRIRGYYNSLYQDFVNPTEGLKDTFRNRFAGIHLQKQLPGKKHLSAYGFGAEYRWLRSNQIRNKGFLEFSPFVKIVHNIRDDHKLQFCGNFEYNNGFGLFLSPTIDYIFHVTPQIKLGFTNSYTRRLPNFFELYWNDSIFKGNTNLLEEKIEHAEINIHLFRNKINQRSSLYIKQIKKPVLCFLSDPSSKTVSFRNGSTELFSGYDHQISYFLSSKTILRSRFDIILLDKMDHSFLINYPNLVKEFSLEYRNIFFNNNLRTAFNINAKLFRNSWNFVAAKGYYYYHDFSNNIKYVTSLPLIDIVLDMSISSLQLQISVNNILSSDYTAIDGLTVRKTSVWMRLNWIFEN